MRSKILVIFIIFITVLVAGCTKNNESTNDLDKIIERNKLIVGVKYDTKPFGYINENEQLVGFDIDLAKYIAKSILGDESKIEFKQVTPSNRILALNSGQVDIVIATMTVTEQRKQVINFSAPYYIAGQAVLVPQDSKIKSMSDLNGKRVIIIFSSTSEEKLRLVAPEAKILGFKTYTSGYSAFKQGRADAMSSDDSILMGITSIDKSVRMLPQRYTKEPYAIGFKKDSSSLTLENKIDSILAQMKANGELNNLKHKWIKD